MSATVATACATMAGCIRMIGQVTPVPMVIPAGSYILKMSYARDGVPHWTHDSAAFAEDQARYVIALPAGEADKVAAEAKAAGVPVVRLGTVGGDKLDFGAAGAVAVSDLKAAFDNWFPAFMAGKAA